MKVLGKSRLWMWLPFLHLLASGAEHEEAVRHTIEWHRGQGAAVTQRRQWVLDGCRKLSGLLRQKAVVLNKLQSAVRAVEKDASLSDEEKLFQVHMFEIFQKELNESENSVFQAIHGLQRALQGDYRDVVNVKESSRQRLEALRKAAIKEETEYVELLAAEKHQVEALKNMQHRNKSLSLLDEILEDVRKAADRLEKETEERAFDDNKSVRGVNFEAVLRVEEEEASSKQNLTKREVEEDLGLSMLIDSQNNQYILTKPRDATIPRADPHLIKDIVTIGMLSLPCGWLCTMIGLPTMFGYIICGVLLGPSGLNSIKSVVQVETLGEFGVFFTLFLVGLEFSPEKLRKVWKISLQGPCYMTLLMVAFGLVWGHLLQIRPTQSVFISTCLSLSSTPLVSKFLVGSTRSDREAGDIDYGAVLLGMLVTQDVQLGLFIAVLPTLIQAGAGAHASVAMEILRVLGLVGQVLFSLAAVLLFCLVMRTYLVGPYCRKLHAESKGNKEILILGISAFIFLMLTVTELLDVSMELGCFLAGALVSSQGHVVAEEVVSYVEPVRDFLAIVFFASIGLHVFPTFVLYELTVLLVLTLSVVVMKFVLAALVLSLLLPKTSQYVKWIVAAGLAQVSEFSLVLGSRARRARVISREVYLLILSVTTLSLLLAPLLWRAAVTRCAPRPERRSSL
ncbi:transmembrane and coiled-coil domain-containing protein 3 isoform X1 [Balaenoptera musculus]|uniref:Transmembrane and coiled-coil domain-containing protein 3 isoform X1 n=1 Tax=Balaenoptera musculus TaxID=9771 RepID=A0A8B8VR90_BALMU|nr:transmembrane and coiled-coil domain-containing protein 3 isoform X1 [Balaenoptera musculus]XP_036687418.1 transmembrane and coiled-coil domain-containing protein 3 isoform X1 [Balaenoptera musculus]XP_036687420.1 transmembrane and coiled-coil domain-containing protein 3 isoform X1 [Balaenoptera musculus]XP_036687421.1 transmembrane and coiled-coil domain-containing protein 3 isoform X1 [Balaenoptera musculus]